MASVTMPEFSLSTSRDSHPSDERFQRSAILRELSFRASLVRLEAQ